MLAGGLFKLSAFVLPVYQRVTTVKESLNAKFPIASLALISNFVVEKES
jgi:hypothetical protein